MLTVGSKVKIKNENNVIKGNNIFKIEDFVIKGGIIRYILNNGSLYLTEDDLIVIEEPKMKLQNIILEHKDNYTNLYHLNYKNLDGKPKNYEMISRKNLFNKNLEIGKHTDAITMVIKHKTENKYLLLREFRPAANTFVFNLVAGLIDEGETSIDACIREIWEETNIKITKENIIKKLSSSYSAIGLSDEQVETFFVEIDGSYDLHTDGNPNECIYPRFYSLEEIKFLLQTEKFTSRTQMLFEILCIQEDNKTFFN